jgi:LPS sulfotransferase NodH
MGNTVRFIMLMPWGRVGSNLLMSILRQSAPMKLDNEHFNRLKTDAEQESWLAHFYELGSDMPSSHVIGSKQNMLAIRDFEATRCRLEEHSIRVVRLRRDNIVKTAVSQMRAEQYAAKTERETGTRQWAVSKGAEPLGATELDPNILFNRIKLIEDLQRRLMAGFSPQEVLDLEYEEINRSIDMAAAQLCAFLNIAAKTRYRIPHRKATPDDVRISIANLSDVKEKLAETPYARMLSDEANLHRS